MRTRFVIGVIALSLVVANAAWCADADIRLNSLGFLPKMQKKATIVSACSSFTVKKVPSGPVVYTGTVTGPLHQDDVGQDVWVVDFSAVGAKGRFYLDVPGVGRSFEFEIGDAVYDFAFFTAMRSFYLWRCGTAVEGEHNGQRYAHAACHMEDGWQDYIGIKDSRRDGIGGWHDAGDYGKYVVNAGVTVGCLFMAWDHFQDRLKGVSLKVPNTAPGYPDFLKELKWETDWLLKMAYPDGSGKVSHKLTRVNFEGFVMPETDSQKRYFTEWSSAAVADFVAMMAMAARYFKPYDAEYANRCLDAAHKSYAFLIENPQPKGFVQGPFRTGGYQTGDSDDRLWAAAEMWETTGKAECLKDFEARAVAPQTGGRGGRQSGEGFQPLQARPETTRPSDAGTLPRSQGRDALATSDENWDWGNVRNLGMFTYVLSKREGRDPNLLAQVRRDALATADALVAKAKQDVYGRPLAGRYYWGCNGTVARQVVNLYVAQRVSANQDYVNTALDAVAHLFGRNYYGRSYVTGLGHQPPMNPHDRRSGADGIEAPWPGYIVGGGQSAKNWTDSQADYRTNEIAINWQAALVYALAGFTSGH